MTNISVTTRMLSDLLSRLLLLPPLSQIRVGFQQLFNRADSNFNLPLVQFNLYTSIFNNGHAPLEKASEGDDLKETIFSLKNVRYMNEIYDLPLPGLNVPNSSDQSMGRGQIVAYLNELVNDLARGRQCFVNLYGIIGTGRTYLLKEIIAPKCAANNVAVLWFELEKQFNDYIAIQLANHVLKQLSIHAHDKLTTEEISNLSSVYDDFNIPTDEVIGKKFAKLLERLIKKLKEVNVQIAVFIDDLDFLTRTEHKWFQQYILDALTETSEIGVFTSSQTPIAPWRWQFRNRIRFIELNSFSVEEILNLCDGNREIAHLIQCYSGGHPATVIKLIDTTNSCLSDDNEGKENFQFTEKIKEHYIRVLYESIEDNLARVNKNLQKFFYYVSAAITFDPNLLRDIAAHFNFSENVTDYTDLAWDMSATGLVEWDSIEGRYSGYYLAQNLRYRIVFLSQAYEAERPRYIETIKLLIEIYETRARREFQWSEAFALYLYYTGLLAGLELQYKKQVDPFVILRDSLKKWLQREDVEGERKNILAVKQALQSLSVFKNDFQGNASTFLRHLDRLSLEQMEGTSV